MGISSLTKDFALIFNDDDDLTGDEYVINDVTETHFGAEYNVKGGDMPIFLRGGLFTSPNHSVKFDPPNPELLTTETKAAESALYNTLPREMETRGTIGAGFVFGQRGQFDVAYVYGREFVASAAIRFR